LEVVKRGNNIENLIDLFIENLIESACVLNTYTAAVFQGPKLASPT
jgi:hypothetical protein